MKYRNLKSPGFTLVELLVTCVLVGIVSVLLASFTANWLQDNAKTRAKIDLLADAQSALDKTANDIRLSGAADQNNRWADLNAPNNQFGWESNAQTLVLANVAQDTNRDVIYSDASQYISLKNNVIYFTSNHNLYRRVLAAPDPDNSAKTTCPKAEVSSTCPEDNLVATNVESFQVRYYDLDENQVSPTNARSIGLSIKLTTHKYGQEISQSYDTRMVFRND